MPLPSTASMRSRQGFRLQMFNERKRVDDMLSGVAEPDLRIMSRVELKLREYLSRCYELDTELQRELEAKGVSADDSEAEAAQTAGFNNEAMEFVLELHDKIQSVVVARTPPPTQLNAPANPLNISTQSHYARVNIKLPKLDTPTFSGDFLEWQTFWDLYRTSVHEHPELSNAEKFTYLVKCLSGEALSVIEGFTIKDDTYPQAVQVLEERFGDPQRAKFGHFQALLKIQPVTHSHKLADLMHVYDQCERHIRSLIALGLDESTFSVVFAPMILSKLPSDVITLLSQKNGRDEWKLENIRKWLKDEIWARELGESLVAGNKKEEDNRKNYRPSNEKPKATDTRGSASMLVSPTKGKKQTSAKCGFCDQAHFSDQCTQFPDVASRRNVLRSSERCFKCLRRGHAVSNCQVDIACAHCRKKGHHRSLCFEKFGGDKSRKPPTPAFAGVGKGSEGKHNQLNVDAAEFVPGGNSELAAVAQDDEYSETVVSFLPTALTLLHNDQQSCKMQGRVILDTASSRSYVTQDVCKNLGLSVVGETFASVGRFGSSRRVTSKTQRVQLSVECTDGTRITLIAHVVPVISSPVFRAAIDPVRFPIVKQLHMAEPLNPKLKSLPLDLLIGSDYYYEFVTPEAVIPCRGGPTLVGSKLGFLTAGTMPVDETSEPESTLVLLLTESAPGRRDPLDRIDLERFWTIEEIGTKSKEKDDISDEKALKNFYETLQFENGRYFVTWPWKSKNPELASNRGLALARLRSTYSRLCKNPELLKAYDEIIQNQLKLGVVEVAPRVPTGPEYYVPHHEVITPSKTTTKIRVVYDASSKAKKDAQSLNDCLHRGKVILEDLCGLLIRFRTKKIGIVADIEKAFLQIGLQESERDVARFFWVKNLGRPITSENLVTYRFARVFFGAIASPSLLGSTLDAHARKLEASAQGQITREMAKTFRENIYSDNHISGEDDTEKAVLHYQETKKLCQGASMNLREFYTNSRELKESMDPSDRGQSTSTKVLGVRWNTDTDTLQCSGLKPPKILSGLATKRSIVSEVAQIFDPCGWFSPVTLLGKLLIQELWQSEIGWDQSVPEEINVQWQKVRSTLDKIPAVELPRYIGVPKAGHELHVFCDASQKAAAAVVYWRMTVEGTIDCNLVCAKSRLAPLKPHPTIPRLELVAVDLGVKLIEFVSEYLHVEIGRKFVWSDSQCVLAWIGNARLTTKFVKSRVDAIRSVKNLSFRFVPGTENPADLPSRGCTAAVLQECTKWWKGPPWLAQDESAWPVEQPDKPNDVEDATEIPSELELTLVTTEIELVIDFTRFSSLNKLTRVAAYVLRAVTNFREKRADRLTGDLSLAELAKARLFLEKRVQQEVFPEMFGTKNIGQALKKSPLRQLNVEKDAEGLLRCRSRLQNSNLPFVTQNPIVLPKHHPFSDLVIRQAHVNALHAGASQTLVEVRKRYWVMHGRNQVKRVLRECRKCRRVEGGAYTLPPAPALPAIRVTEKTPFAYTGLDYLGPLVAKETTVGTRRDMTSVTRKIWVCLFTCALTRAVHLEIVENQSANEFHLALRRFLAIYGMPLVIVSDNASQFRAVEEAIKKLRSTTPESSHMGIEWRKITEAAPWMGGFYERMVGLVKRFLKKTLDGICATISELRTIVAEITSVVNSRPLLYVENETTSYPLSPNDFLGKFARPGFPAFDESNRMATPNTTVGQLVENWKRLQSVSSQFWRMWRQAYLTSLREKHSNAVQRNPSLLRPTVGSVVQIKDNVPRGQWRLGKIVELIESRDGKVRSAILKLANGRSITRPLRLLYPLEMGPRPEMTPDVPSSPNVHVDAIGTASLHDDDNLSEAESGFSLGEVQTARERLHRFADMDNFSQPTSPPAPTFGPGGADSVE